MAAIDIAGLIDPDRDPIADLGSARLIAEHRAQFERDDIAMLDGFTRPAATTMLTEAAAVAPLASACVLLDPYSAASGVSHGRSGFGILLR